MDLLGQTALLVAVTSFGLGCSVVTRNVRNKLFLTFLLMGSVVAGWAFAFFLEKIWPGYGFYRWHLFFNIWIAPAGLGFIRLMVRIQDRLSRRLQDATLLLALVMTVALLAGWDSHPLVLQAIYFVPVVIVLQILQLMWFDRSLRRGLRRGKKLPTVGFGRRNLIYAGGLLVLCSSVMDHVPWLGAAPPVIGNLALTAYLFFLSQAITQQRLLNFGALLSRFFVLLVIALTLTGVYSLLFAWIQNSFGLFFLNSFIISFLLVTLLEPIRTMVGYFTERLLTQKHLRLQQALREAQRRLTGIIDPITLFQAVLVTSQQALQPQWAALFVLRGDATKYRRIRSVGDEPQADGPVLTELLVNHPLLQYCEDLHRRGELPILLDQILENEIDRSASRLQRESLSALLEGLKALRANLLIPLFDIDKILGFIILYAPQPPEPWGNNWGLLPMIYPYFEHAGQTLHNMDIYARQREKERLATLGEMAAGLAHEIRNPLGAIKGAAQYLDPTGDRPDSRFLGIIVEEVDRLNRVVAQFLDYSKPPTTDLKSVDIVELVERTVELLRPSIRPEIRLEVTQGPKPLHWMKRSPLRVMASPEQLRQVLINLIQNSEKALEGRAEGHIRVGIEIDGDERHGEVSLQVEDNGQGIKKEHLEKLFIPFFTTSPSGTGLGLSISQKIVEAHRGRLEVLTEEGRFTRFSVILPVLSGDAG